MMKEDNMTKAKLIKKDEVLERQQRKIAQKAQKQTVKQTVDVVSNWIEKQSTKRLDPRAAFAALFAEPQAQ
jgi:hypothetical protein